MLLITLSYLDNYCNNFTGIFINDIIIVSCHCWGNSSLLHKEFVGLQIKKTWDLTPDGINSVGTAIY